MTAEWRESARPALTVNWPADLDERDPPLEHSAMPLNLPDILRDLDSIRRDLDAEGGRLLLSTFFWLAYDGMRLDPVRNGNVVHYLHRVFWPFSYAHIGRMAAFQNRVFAKYAAARRIELLDFAAAFPRDPNLFVDAIHVTAGGGTRLQGWVMLQLLLPVVERLLAEGALPRPDRSALDHHPAFTGHARQWVPIATLLTGCSR
jgi:hypothetical protein